jgi:hypothetical protein
MLAARVVAYDALTMLAAVAAATAVQQRKAGAACQEVVERPCQRQQTWLVERSALGDLAYVIFNHG